MRLIIDQMSHFYSSFSISFNTVYLLFPLSMIRSKANFHNYQCKELHSRNSQILQNFVGFLMVDHIRQHDNSFLHISKLLYQISFSISRSLKCFIGFKVCRHQFSKILNLNLLGQPKKSTLSLLIILHTFKHSIIIFIVFSANNL